MERYHNPMRDEIWSIIHETGGKFGIPLPQTDITGGELESTSLLLSGYDERQKIMSV
jgi:hypothetical protein